MRMAVKKNIILAYSYFKFNFKSNWEYNVNFFTQILMIFISNLSTLFFWDIIFKNINYIDGYSFYDLIILLGVSSSVSGVTYLVFGNSSEIHTHIVNGSLDGFLVQPKDLILNISCSKMNIFSIGDIIYGYILLIIVKGFSFSSLFTFTLLVSISSIIFFSTLVLLNSLTFYIKNIEHTKRFLEVFILTFSKYPEDIFSTSFRVLFYSLLPIGFMFYLPVSIMKNFNILSLILLILVSLLYLALSYYIFYKGLKKYESSNLIENKI